MRVREACHAAIDLVRLLDVGPYRLGKDRLGHLERDEVATQPRAARFRPDHAQRRLEPRAGFVTIAAQVNERRQSLEQQMLGSFGQREMPADKLGVAGRSLTAPDQRAVAGKPRTREHVIEWQRLVGPGMPARQDMRRPVRNDDQIALGQVHRRRMSFDAHHGLAPVREVEPRHVAERRHAHAPGFGKAGAEVERAAKRQAGEDITKQVQHGRQNTGFSRPVQSAGRSGRISERPGIHHSDQFVSLVVIETKPRRYSMKTLTLIIGLAVATTGAVAQAGEAMNDLEIAHTAYTAGQLDIRYAHLALAVSENDAVREFAQTMIRDHTAVNEAAGALITELNVTPQDNALSQALVQGAADKRDELAVLSGKAFDCAYATNELGYHQVVNKTVAETFIPAVTVEPLKTLLEEALVTFKQHEGHAEVMVKGLQCS
jgi:putative membrane protein